MMSVCGSKIETIFEDAGTVRRRTRGGGSDPAPAGERDEVVECVTERAEFVLFERLAGSVLQFLDGNGDVTVFPTPSRVAVEQDTLFGLGGVLIASARRFARR
ncbi:MAG: hypothetical protein IPI49_03360 [Myxococcales bacterium]|nr:hypothetical protein [Myxococcales bacterium]